MAPRNDRQTPIFFGRIVQIDHHRQQIVVGVREERIILVPFEAGLAAARRFEIELGMVQLDIWPNQVLDYVQNLRIEDEIVERLMVRNRVEDAANRPLAIVGLGDRELVVGLLEALGLGEHFGQGRAQGC